MLIVIAIVLLKIAPIHCVVDAAMNMERNIALGMVIKHRQRQLHCSSETNYSTIYKFNNSLECISSRVLQLLQHDIDWLEEDRGFIDH